MLRLLLVGTATALWTSVLILSFWPEEDQKQAELATRALVIQHTLSIRSAEELEAFTERLEKNCLSLSEDDWPSIYRCVTDVIERG